MKMHNSCVHQGKQPKMHNRYTLKKNMMQEYYAEYMNIIGKNRCRMKEQRLTKLSVLDIIIPNRILSEGCVLYENNHQKDGL